MYKKISAEPKVWKAEGFEFNITIPGVQLTYICIYIFSVFVEIFFLSPILLQAEVTAGGDLVSEELVKRKKRGSGGVV